MFNKNKKQKFEYVITINDLEDLKNRIEDKLMNSIINNDLNNINGFKNMIEYLDELIKYKLSIK